MSVHYINIYCPISRGLAKDFELLKGCIAHLNGPVVFYHNCIFQSVFIDGQEYLPSHLSKLNLIKYKYRYSFFSRFSLFRNRCFNVSISVERLHKGMTLFSKYIVLIPNLEWFRFVEKKAMERVTHVLTKTEEAQTICSKIFPKARVMYTSFSSPNLLKKEIHKANPLECIHVGGSHQKGTEEVLELWSSHPEWPHLHLITGKYKIQIFRDLKNVTYYTDRLPDDSFQKLLNQCLVHVCPSRVEGFGHTLNEGMACEAVVITTDAAPMNEVIPKAVCNEYGMNVFCRTLSQKKQYEGTSYKIDAKHLEEVLADIFSLPYEQLFQYGKEQYKYYLKRDAYSRRKIVDALDQLLN